MNPQILEYIRVQRAAGNPDETIVQNLRTTGWPEDMIKQAMQTPVTALPLAPSPTASMRSGKQLLSAAVDAVRAKLTVLILLGAIAGAPSIVGSFSKELVDLAAGNGATLITLTIAFVILLIASSILSVISTIGIATVLIHRDREVSFQEAFMAGLHKFIPFAWILFLTGFIQMGGFILLIIPGIIFTVWFCFSYFIYLAEGVTGMNALLRSREYVRGYGFQIMTRFAFLTVITIILTLAFRIATALVPSEPAQNILGYIFSLVLTPVSVAFALFMYEDMRAIKGSVEHTVSPRNKMIYLGVACLGFVLVLGGIVWGIFQAVNMYTRATSGNRAMNISIDEAQDTQRRIDIVTIQNALTDYEDDEDMFPAYLDLLAPEYLRAVPRDPNGVPYSYTPVPGSQDYRLCATYSAKGELCVSATTQPAL